MQRKIPILGAALPLLATGRAFAEAKPHSTSTSRQFVVYGAEVRVRGAVCDLAERTKTNLLRLLGLADDWKTPLVVNLDYPQANFPENPAAQLDFSQTGFGLKLQLNLLVTRDLNGRAVQRELLRAILLEMMYRERADVPAGTPYVEPPDWLINGVLQLAPGRDSDETAQLLQTLVAARKIAPLGRRWATARAARFFVAKNLRCLFHGTSAIIARFARRSPETRPLHQRFALFA